MTIACVFPGQGSQFCDMGRSLAEQFSHARDVFQRVDDALGESLSKIIWEGDADTLRQTRNAQPALLAVSVAVIEAIKQESQCPMKSWVSHVAGHSLGEYSALVCAEALTLEDATRLVRIRADAMQKAVPDGKGTMIALLGGTLSVIENLLANHALDQGICAIANDNAPGQVVLSGERVAVETMAQICQKKAGVRRAIPLSVSAPFHCSLMEPAVHAVAKALKNVSISVPKISYIPNVTGEIFHADDCIDDLLIKQITEMVRWRSTVLTMANNGIKTIVECGAGSVLSGLVKRIAPDIKSLAISEAGHIKPFCATIANLLTD